MDISSPEKLLIANRRRRVVELRRDGMSLESIADTIRSEFELPNYCKQRSHDDVLAALSGANKLTATEVAAYRKIEEMRLDYMFSKLLPGIEASDVKSIDAGVKVCHRKARLLGLDAATQAMVEDTVQEELNAVLDGLQRNLSPQTYEKVLEILSGRTDILKAEDLEEDD
jgi:hypothetical protein